MSTEGLLAALQAGLGALDKLGAGYALIGGAALPAWGRVRATQDVDVLVGLDWSSEQGGIAAASIVTKLREAGFAHLERADRKRLDDKLVLHFWYPLRPQGISLRLDVILVPGPRGKDIVARAAPRKIDGLEVRVASCEDLVLLKLAAGRAVDAADAEELLRLNAARIDWRYLEVEAASWGVGRSLVEVRRRSQGPGS